jgi:hypothetical protein
MSAAKSASYHVVHYLLRPAKNIQRKMLVQLFQRVGMHRPMEDYRYVGFGSVYFGDFALFHRSLGIRKMVTIEGNEDDAERFRFNAPYKCIEFLFGHSSQKLDEVPWDDAPAIVWLDYDYGLEESTVFDAKLTLNRMQPMSVFLVTIDAEQKTLEKPFRSGGVALEVEEFEEMAPRDKLLAKIGSGNATYLPESVDLRGDGLGEAYRQTLANAVEQVLATKNQALPDGKKLRFVQLVNFRYADGNLMMTWGGILVEESHPIAANFVATGLAALDFVRTGADMFDITAPKLTFKEIHELNKHMPMAEGTKIEKLPLSEADIEHYRRVYRYFPAFTEAEI